MLEYDYRDMWEYSDTYNFGFENGYVSSMIKIVKIYYMDYCKGASKGLYRAYPKDMADYLVEFMDKYYGLSEKSMTRRFISESEFLPWRL